MHGIRINQTLTIQVGNFGAETKVGNRNNGFSGALVWKYLPEMPVLKLYN